MKKHIVLHEKIQDLETIEKYFQQPDIDLEEAIAKHKQAIGLAREILEYLEEAENELTKIDIQSLRQKHL